MSRIPLPPLLLLAACVDGPGTSDVVPALDHARFVERVQPVLEASCASPSCHGTARPLELFAPGMHRLDPGRTWLNEPISDEEAWRNHLRAACFVDASDPAMSPLLRKPLAGGLDHVGGDLWLDTSDPAYLEVLAWARGEPLEGDTAMEW